MNAQIEFEFESKSEIINPYERTYNITWEPFVANTSQSLYRSFSFISGYIIILFFILIL